jgi:hypothetical protein
MPASAASTRKRTQPTRSSKRWRAGENVPASAASTKKRPHAAEPTRSSKRLRAGENVPASAALTKKRPHTAEPTRSSKRLRGMEPSPIQVKKRLMINVTEEGAKERTESGQTFESALSGETSIGAEEDDVVGQEIEKTPQEQTQSFMRTLSGASSTGIEDDDIETPVSTQSTLATPNDPISPHTTRVSDDTWDRQPEVPRGKATAVPSQQPHEQTKIRPAYTNVVPAAELIDEYPPMRVVFREHCYYREKAATPQDEWQSDGIIGRCEDEALRAHFEDLLDEHGFITLPDDLFHGLTNEQLPRLYKFLVDFFELYSLPGQHLPTISSFIDPVTGTLDIVRLIWWEGLCVYFRVENYFERIFAPYVREWHVVYHALPTFALMREFCAFLERCRVNRRGAENMHQELARRLACVMGCGEVNVVEYAKMCRWGGDKLRNESVKYDGMEESWDDCAICVVKPAFRSDRFFVKS